MTRFTSDYGMVFVLLLLCVCFSLATFKRQELAGTAAAEELLQRIVDIKPQGQVLIFGNAGNDDFTTALYEVLKADTDSGIDVRRPITGDPSDYRGALEKVLADNETLAVIVCNRSTADLNFLKNIETSYPQLAEVQILGPKTYYWPDFLTSANLRAVTIRIAVLAIIAIGMTCVIISAGIDLSVGSLIALSAVISALWIREIGGAEKAHYLHMVLGACVGILACGLLGAVNGTLVTFCRVPAFVATLCMMQIASGLAYILSQSESIFQLPESFTLLGRGQISGVPIIVLLMLILYLLAHLVMTYSVLGRYIYAVGGNAEAARLSGVPVRAVTLVCYTLCGALAGLGGVIRASELRSGDPQYGQMAELDIIAAVVVGGTSLSGGEGKILGTLIGALIIGVIRNGMNLTDIESNTQKVVLGVVILIAVLVDLHKQGWKK